jgi:2-polyprenyl-3-methyl-5-hydroxy-6-metoxy-1,4-benzoquinol methylase
LGGEDFPYSRCQECRTLFNAEVPADLAKYYPADYYRWPDADQIDAGAQAEAPRVAMIAAQIGTGRLVEMGAGFGMFARAAKLAGFDVTAVEMDGACCRYLESTIGVTTVCSDAPADAVARLPPSDAVAMWHSLEHMVDPWTVMDAVAANLRTGGVLALAMPNPDAFQFRVLGKHWVHVDAPRHLFLIPLPALVGRLARRGVHLVSATTDDQSGRYWNRFGWERSLQANGGAEPPPRAVRALARAVTAAMRPVERRPMVGAAYTAIFVKSG